MAKNKIQDLKDHLFAQLERLNDETISSDDMKEEIHKASAIEGISKQLVEIEKVNLDKASLHLKYLNAGYTTAQIPMIDNAS